jgi:hypothetical protein
MQVLRKIENKCGSDVLTNGYAKLTRLSGICTANATGMNEESEHLVQYVLESLWWSLKFEFVAPKDVTQKYLDKARDGTMGADHLALARKHICNLISGWAEDLKRVPSAASLAAEVAEVIGHFCNYRRYEKAFADGTSGTGRQPPDASREAPAREAGESGEDMLVESAAPEQDRDPVDVMKAKYKNKASHSIIDFLYDLLSCTHDKVIGEVVTTTAIKDAQWLEASGLESLREVCRLLNLHTTVISTSVEGPPGEATRTLKRYKSEAEGNPEHEEELRKERMEAWKQAQAARKKLVHVGFARVNGKPQMQQFFEKTPLHQFVGKPGEAHRVFIFSSELFQEARNNPWSTPADLGNAADTHLSWLVGMTGPSDVIMLMDGRSRACRRKLEKVAGELRHLHEAWLVYKPTKRLGRRVAFGADNKEMVLVSLPVSRASLTITPRDDYNGREHTRGNIHRGPHRSVGIASAHPGGPQADHHGRRGGSPQKVSL